ncbi:hypothetical protein GNX71_28470 [Variovorax sp. RKNM96]|uniref:hypothetical protein n=1 Tax=Variovorax sp. RKNM96 TaxID=2681552 RepID=UPI0019815321|nr:hypothetical protein [Variovorax sp. RKNM96]QSI33290.1 hypothetical protein GNX71_28470 [Variovorax sp. RKNM96]
MDSLLTAIFAAAAALAGVALTSYTNFQTQRRNHQFQMDAEAAKHDREKADKQTATKNERITQAHIALSRLAREFSMTSLDILWRAGMKAEAYDQRYLAACAEMDSLRAFAELYEPGLSPEIEELHGQMNLFWGHFNNVLHRTHLGYAVDDQSSSLQSAHAAAREIGSKALLAKWQLARLVPR